KPAVVAGIITIAIDNILAAFTTEIKTNDVSSDKLVNKIVVTTNKNKPLIDNQRAPKRSNNLPVIGFINPIIIAPGSNASPDSKAENPSIFCMKNGKITAVPIIDIKTTIPKPVEIVNILYLKILNSSIGSSNFNWRRIKMVNVIAPTISDIKTC